MVSIVAFARRWSKKVFVCQFYIRKQIIKFFWLSPEDRIENIRNQKFEIKQGKCVVQSNIAVSVALRSIFPRRQLTVSINLYM